MTPNNTLECVLGGAQWRLWPAAQLGR